MVSPGPIFIEGGAWDFINDDAMVGNEPGDPESQHNHGTYTLSALAGFMPGQLVGLLGEPETFETLPNLVAIPLVQIRRHVPDDFRLGVEMPDPFVELSVEQAESAAAAGAEFCVIPGVDVPTAQRSVELGMLTLPGVQTPAEIQTALRAGADVLKFFPVEAMGGVATLKAIHGPYYNVRFIPTGGITTELLPSCPRSL